MGSQNELGSLYRDRAWLLRKQEAQPKEIEKLYEEAIAYSNEAIDFARSNKLFIQEIDTIDDLAQAHGDEAFFWYENGDSLKAQSLLQDSRAHLTAIINHKKLSRYLVKSDGFNDDLEDWGAFNWLALGKAHLWLGVWQFREILYLKNIDTELHIKEATEKLVLAQIYFEQFAPRSFQSERSAGFLADFLKEFGKTAEQSRALVKQLAQKYGHSRLTLVTDKIDKRLGHPTFS